MIEGSEETGKKRICAGLLAHVDAGKTTLAEGLLYTGGQIRTLGRVDHGNALLDNFSLERERGITIFSKQAQLTWKDMEIILLDTPGHVDFSAEMERTLQVLDYAVLVISGTDGIQSHVQTLWRLLGQYRVPTFLFINKMDRPGADRAELLKELQEKLGAGCQEFGPEAESRGESFREEISLCEEGLLEKYLDSGSLHESDIAGAVRERHIFPCYFGSALLLTGVEELLDGLARYTLPAEYPGEFGARVYKISRDESGTRLTHLKVTGGVLKVKMAVGNACSAPGEEQVWEEKADQLRLYEGGRYSTVPEVEAGGICAVTGLEKTFAGQGLGRESQNGLPILAPVLTYGLVLPEGSDAVKVLGQLRRLEEEEPQLHVVWQRAAGGEQDRSRPEIHVQVMGEVQIEVLKRLIADRFGLKVEFTDGEIVYKETIAGAVEGIGHFEPLRHYAEVHLLLEPGEPGSGLQFASACSEDVLDRNWQRLILTHLEERSYPGVLTGSPITDMRITLLTGRAHNKHTEGGDFRQATYRAVRQGLMQSESILLEPVFAFTLEVPGGQLGRAMSDIQRMQGSFEPPIQQGEYSVLKGSAPAAAMRGYQKEVNAYTRGLGRLSCHLKGYEPCHNTESVLERFGYDPDTDQENPSSSVFCAHGAGFVVPWNQVAEYAHVESGWREAAGEQAEEGRNLFLRGSNGAGKDREQGPLDYITQEEIEEIFQRTYRKSRQDFEPYRYYRHSVNNVSQDGGGAGSFGDTAAPQTEEEAEIARNECVLKNNKKTGAFDYNAAPQNGKELREGAGVSRPMAAENSRAGKRGRGSFAAGKEDFLLVDGYNIIFAWEDLHSLAEVNIDGARDRLMDICSNYQGFTGCTLILVYDAYKVKGNPGSVQKYHNIYVVYTKEAETADQYIEKTVHEIGRKHNVTVATSDRLEQMIIWGEGAARLSAQGFREAVNAVSGQMREQYLGRRDFVKNRPFEELRAAGKLTFDRPE